MKITKNTFYALLSLAFGVLLFTACSNDSDDGTQGRLQVSAKAVFASSADKSARAAKTINASLEITDLRMNLSEFELELDDDAFEDAFDSDGDDDMDDDDMWDDDGFLDFEDEIELQGPFELDLLSGQITFINTTVPNGRFEEVEFEFDKSTDPESDLFGKSILMKGTIDGLPFIFWHDFEDEIEVDYDDPSLDLTINDGTEGIVVVFDFGLLLNGANGLDFSSAADGNGDGIIEISPEDTDGNNALANAIRSQIREYIDLLDD